MRNADSVFVEKPERKLSLGIARHRKKYNIKIDLQEIGCDAVDWIHLVDLWRSLVNTAMNPWFHNSRGIP
jgi:hypothetical protein